MLLEGHGIGLQYIDDFELDMNNNELYIQLSDDTLRVIDISPLLDNTDDQQIQNFSYNPLTQQIYLTIENGGSDNVPEEVAEEVAELL